MTNKRSILLATAVLLVAASCLGQSDEPDAVMPTPPQILRNGGFSDTPDDVLKALSAESPSVRIAAAQVAGERRMTQTIRKLQALLVDVSEVARIEAAHSLLVMGDSSGLPELQRLVRSKDAFVVTEAAKVLATTNDMSGFDEIATRLQSGKASVGDRIIFIQALQTFRAYEPLRQQVRSLLVKSALDDPSADVRLAAVQHLQKDESPEAQAALSRAYQKETDPVIRGVLEVNQQRRAAKREQ
ncbi:MAG TPA: HEAT repeat domain-containing protein [Thermoanaerobaculia bacterium]|nr:HEAT repeat domain-containing protein [Thermoanaerobaculia bacterium]